MLRVIQVFLVKDHTLLGDLYGRLHIMVIEVRMHVTEESGIVLTMSPKIKK